MYESILLPTDGSQGMDAIVEQATTLATLCDATVHVLHVVDERAYQSVPDDARERVRETLAEDATAATDAVADHLTDAGVDVVCEHQWGDPAAGILSYAVDEDLDAIIMGTHGRTGYERYMMGSVAEKVVRLSPIPVLVIDVGETEQKRDEIRATDAAAPIQPADDPDPDEVGPS